MITFNGHDAVSVYAIRVLASGLALYAKTGMVPNRAYTPTKMLRRASEYTGVRYKRGQYLEAAEALIALAKAKAASLPDGNSITSV